MNKILVQVSVGELLDKLSILEIKKDKIKDIEKLKFINNEYKVLKDQFNQNIKSDEKLDKLFNSLKHVYTLIKNRGYTSTVSRMSKTILTENVSNYGLENYRKTV